MNRKVNIIRRKSIEVLLGVLSCCFIMSGCSLKSKDVKWELDDTASSATQAMNGNESPQSPIEDTKVKEPKMILVHICGEINNPGVYELAENSRLYEAIDAAGGMTNKADKEFLNLARTVTDGEQICVPDKYSANQVRDLQNTSKSKLININTASEKELTSISGIGESRANAIISYREKNGQFKKIEDIKKVQGIKDSLFNKIKDKITV